MNQNGNQTNGIHINNKLNKIKKHDLLNENNNLSIDNNNICSTYFKLKISLFSFFLT